LRHEAIQAAVVFVVRCASQAVAMFTSIPVRSPNLCYTMGLQADSRMPPLACSRRIVEWTARILVLLTFILTISSIDAHVPHMHGKSSKSGRKFSVLVVLLLSGALEP
jgi:hypothetical protein